MRKCLKPAGADSRRALLFIALCENHFLSLFICYFFLKLVALVASFLYKLIKHDVLFCQF